MNAQEYSIEIQRLAEEIETDVEFSAASEQWRIEDFVDVHGYRPESHWYD